MSLRRSPLGALCAAALGLPASAHHSHGNYPQYFIDLQGTVAEVQLSNPHSWIYLETRERRGALPVDDGFFDP